MKRPIKRAHVSAALLSKIKPGQNFVLPEDTARRFTRILRLGHGDMIELFDGQGLSVIGVLQLAPQPMLTAAQVRQHDSTGPRLVVAQAAVKMDKLEEVVQRSTELSATELIWFWAEHSVVKPTEKIEQKTERLQRVADDAARQSLRNVGLQVEGPIAFTDLVEFCASFEGVCVMGVLGADTRLSRLLASNPEKVGQGVCVIVGPEGGLSHTEVERLKKVGVHPVVFAPHVLRTETAALAALACIHVVTGDA